MDISNQHVIITGGASGMGAETARHLAGLGARITVLDINKTNLADVAAETNALALECDVTSESSAKDALEKSIAANGIPRVLINCAGIAPGSRIVGKDGPHSFELFHKTIAVNLIGSFNMLRLAAAAMTTAEPLNADGERGVIINTASVAAYEGQVGQAAYSASKGGVVGMTLPAARELSRFGIRVVTIAPGLIETPMLGGMSAEVQESLIATTLFPKRLGKPSEYARLIAHVIDNAMINGETIRLDGAVRLAPK